VSERLLTAAELAERPALSTVTLLAYKERSLKLPCLLGREAPIRDQFDDLIREFPLFVRKGRRIRVGVQTGANIRVDPRRVRELVSELVQVAHLLEQRLKLFAINGHDPRRIAAKCLHEPFAHPPLALSKQHAAELGEPVRRRVVEGAEDAFPVVDRQGDDQRLPLERVLEDGAGGLIDQGCELPDVLVRNPEAGEVHGGKLLRLRLDPDIEIDALAVDDDLTLADFGLRDDPVTQHHVPRERNLERELNPNRSVRKVETRVVSGSYQESSPTGVRGA
jgi:hypothetical protein